ncbi:MAG: DUF983 domain-containing protein [Rhodospirillales bacterium]
MWPALLRGASGKCPNCGRAKLFKGWLRQIDTCPVCAAPLGAIRADDAPPYIVVFVVGHIVITSQVLLDGRFDLSLWTEAAIFLPLTGAARPRPATARQGGHHRPDAAARHDAVR